MTLTENEEPEIYNQLNRVLRAKPGDKIVLQPDAGSLPVYQYEFDIMDMGKRELKLGFAGMKENLNELNGKLTLVLCVPNRPDKLDFIVQKAVELGVGGIILVEGDFSQFKHQIKLERLEKIIREATEQSERALRPQIEFAGKLRNYIAGLDKTVIKTFYTALERHENKTLTAMLPELGRPESACLLIGPEGGFSPQEIELINTAGIKTFSLGRRILRMETAAILSLGIMASVLE